MIKTRNSHFCVALIALLLGFWSSESDIEKPDNAVKRFTDAFTSGNAVELSKMILPEIAKAKKIEVTDVGEFLVRMNSKSCSLERSKLVPVSGNEDQAPSQFKAFLVFKTTSPSGRYKGPTWLEMDILFTLFKKKWYFERPLSINLRMVTHKNYPTSKQDEIALRYQAAMQVIDKIGLLGGEDLEIVGPRTKGAASELLSELERLHKKELGNKGIEPKSRGVSVFVKAGSMQTGDFLKMYHGDFKSGPEDHRKPVPWDVFRDYAVGAIKMAKIQEKRGDLKSAEQIYRRLIGFGKIILDEPGGLQFVNWGLTFEKIGATALAELFKKSGNPDLLKISEFASLVSRRLDVLGTAQDCLDDMAEFNALKASIMASQKKGDSIFRPWAINSLCIFAHKGAPAQKSIIKEIGVLALISDREMQGVAQSKLKELYAKADNRMRGFIDQQVQWVKNNRVYGASTPFPEKK